MNREQWQQKRQHVESAAQSAFDTDWAAGVLPATARPIESAKVIVAVRKNPTYDALTCCEWSMIADGSDGVPLLPARSE
jgi:hypothetical protein